MLSLFRKNSFFNSLLLLFYALILQIIPAIFGFKLHDTQGLQFGPFRPIVQDLILFILAVFINRLVIENRIHRDIMLFPGLFFILFSVILPEFWNKPDIHIANFFVIWALHELFQIYKVSNPAVHIFNAAFLIGIASIICLPMLWYLLLIFIGITNLKKMKLVHLIQILIGGVIPWFLWITYHVWTGQTGPMIDEMISQVGFDLFSKVPDAISLYKYIGFVFLILFLFVLYNEFRKKKHIQAQKKIDILYLAIIISILAALSHRPFTMEVMLFAAPMIGIFIGLLFSHFKNFNVPEMIHFLLFFTVLVMQVFYYFKF